MTRTVHVVRCPHCGATDSASRFTDAFGFMPPGGWGWVRVLVCTICDGNWFMGKDGDPVKWDGEHASPSEFIDYPPTGRYLYEPGPPATWCS